MILHKIDQFKLSKTWKIKAKCVVLTCTLNSLTITESLALRSEKGEKKFNFFSTLHQCLLVTKEH